MDSNTTSDSMAIPKEYILAAISAISILLAAFIIWQGLGGIASAIKENTQFQQNMWNEQLNMVKQLNPLNQNEVNQQPSNQAPSNQVQQQNQLQQQTQIPKVDLKIDSRPIRGDKNAPLTLVSYEEFVCPFCNRNYPVLKSLENKYKNNLNFIHMNFIVHEQAYVSSRAVECAGDQGKYYEMFDKIFESNGQDAYEPGLIKIGQQLGLDMNKFISCFNSSTKDKILSDQMQAGRELGVGGTPSFVIFQKVKDPKVLANLQKVANDLVKKYGTEANVIEVSGKGYGVFFVGALPEDAFDQVIKAFS